MSAAVPELAMEALRCGNISAVRLIGGAEKAQMDCLAIDMDARTTASGGTHG